MVELYLVVAGAAICGFLALGMMRHKSTDIPPETIMLGQLIVGIIFGLIVGVLYFLWRS